MNSPEPVSQTEEPSPFEKAKDTIALDFGRNLFSFVEGLMEEHSEIENVTFTDTDRLKIYQSYTEVILDDLYDDDLLHADIWEMIKDVLAEDQTPIQGSSS